MDLDGGNVFQVTNNAVLDSGPKWSPGCSIISHNSLDAGSSLDVRRGQRARPDNVNLTNAPGVVDAFSARSPDGLNFVFSSNRDGNFETYAMAAFDATNVSSDLHGHRAERPALGLG